ncbi:MAG: bacillithiol biosynthesis BshC, partial [Spirochaetia bacterium]|nr:bacillithiol biosynthesis BshC [Spirochaetia bacterium]
MTFTTGQQIGLLGGPLYTTYKVLGAAKLAAEKKGKAVYWLETNDADFEEISKLSFINASGELQHLVWEKKTGGQTSGSVLVDESLRALLENYFSALPKTEDRDPLRELAL